MMPVRKRYDIYQRKLFTQEIINVTSLFFCWTANFTLPFACMKTGSLGIEAFLFLQQE
jgi:hypothetical protein